MCPCAGINNLVILLRARYKCNHNQYPVSAAMPAAKRSLWREKPRSTLIDYSYYYL